MNVRAPDGENAARSGALYAVVWWRGELADVETFWSVSEWVSKLKHRTTDQVFQGAAGGDRAIYVFFEQ